MSEASGFSPYVRLWRDWLWPYRWTLSLAILMTVLVSATTGAYSKVIQLVMAALERTDPAVIWWGPLTVLGLTSLSAVGQYYKETISNIVVTHMETDLRKRMFSQLVGADLARLQSEAPAGLAARFSSDISVVGGAVRGYVGGLTNILTIIVSIGVMLTIDWSLTLMILLIFSVALVPVNVIGRRLRKLAKRTQAEISHMTSEVTEGLSSIRMARTYSLEEPLARSAEGVFDRLLGLSVKQYIWRARMAPLMEVLMGIAIAVLLFVVAKRITAGTISIADFTGLLTGFGVLSGPARRIGGSYATLMQGRAALDRIYMLFDAENTIVDGAREVGRVHGVIHFEDVSFAYPDGHVALENVSLTIPQGRKTAFVGRSGAGKSTVFNLLPRLYDPTAGTISIDGIDIRDMTLASLRDQIAVVSQDSVLLSGSVADNIGFGRKGATRAEIEEAARAAAADGFIRALPQGYDTMVRPTEQAFSGGERQRLSIARAMVRNAPILLLDEATSALDAESEAQIQKALARLAEGRTTLVIAHRLATVMDSDLIVVMDRGRVVEMGRHQELLDRGGLYADLFALQFSGA
ncbi:ABC transporter ATP-binding protein [Rhodobacteraceae bacterium DSL-40]|uniref:ABC transporter ATP-binding protein n=1 Tax=Amaricoccus sp. B4 TaxID=3368557 RepID=UPI000DAD2460